MATPKKILIIGLTGQVAKSYFDFGVTSMNFVGRDILDLSNPNMIRERLEHLHETNPFEVLINTAAYTHVDQAEQNKKLAQNVNALSVGVIANWCSEKNIFLIHYSTDYVFSGEGEIPWGEEDLPSPLNVYGQSKLDGEFAIKKTSVNGLIIRTSWVHSPFSKNFVKTMLGLNKTEINVVNDQVGSPTYAGDIARYSLKLISIKDSAIGVNVYHMTNSGEASWFEFAKEIFKQAHELKLISHLPKVNPIRSNEYKSAAKRPLNSRLSNFKLNSETKIILPTWQSGLRDCLLKIKKKEAHYAS